MTPEEVKAHVESRIIWLVSIGMQPSKSELVWMLSWPDLVAAGDRHPWYGPCDAISDGECSECIRIGKA